MFSDTNDLIIGWNPFLHASFGSVASTGYGTGAALLVEVRQ